MTRYVGLLRAVNLGRGSTLVMADLVSLCVGLGFTQVQTYIASGNVVFSSDLTENEVRVGLEQALLIATGKKIAVLMRTGDEVAAVLAENPFANCPSNQVMALFVDDVLPDNPYDGITHRSNEQIGLGPRVLYVFYPSGMGQSKLKIPSAKNGTARNLNSVAKLAAMASN
jgi:uncharacterized protein (DUF1697 family)